jgi:hypothetical protein
MNNKPACVFPTHDHLILCRQFYAAVDETASFDEIRHWQSEIFSAEVHRCRGTVFEKAGIAMICMTGGTVEGASADLTLIQTMAWPTNPFIPGFIIMASTSKIEGQDVMITFYTDLIIQTGVLENPDKDTLVTALKRVCSRHGQSLDEYQAFLAGRGMLGGCAAECGILYFFEERDAGLLEDMMREALNAYRTIIDQAASRKPTENDFYAMNERRKTIIEWILTEDYGVKVARQNNIPLEVMEAYGFPPLAFS